MTNEKRLVQIIPHLGQRTPAGIDLVLVPVRAPFALTEAVRVVPDQIVCAPAHRLHG
jgi:hypothetical protein